MNGYWYHRYNTSQSRDLSMTDLRGSTLKINQTQQQLLKKQHESSVGFLQKKANKINQFATKIGKIQDFFQIMCGQGQQFNNTMGIRCYQHNNQLILYCATDHKLLCANCMYSAPQSPSKISQKPQNKQLQKTLQKSHKKLKSQLLQSTTRHNDHEVKQYQKSSIQISNDIKKWHFQLQQNLSQISSCQLSWNNLYEQYNKTKQILLNQLNKQYDKKQMQLSKNYITIKKQLQNISNQYQIQVNKIINAYKLVKKLLIPNRFPIPCVKHSWFQHMKKIISELPLNTKQENQFWIHGYQGFGRRIVKKLNKNKNNQK